MHASHTRRAGTPKRTLSIQVAWAVCALALACSTPVRIVAEDATLASATERGSSGVGRHGDVQILATAGAWQGDPADLPGIVALHVHVANRSQVPLWIRYDRIALVHPRHLFRTLPPFDTASSDVTARIPSEPEPRGFRIARYHHPFLPRYPRAGPTFVENRAYFRTYHAALRERGLPSASMLRAALPEGVLEPGGTVSGFVFLEDPRTTLERGARVLLEVELVGPPFGEPIGRARIPFELR